MVCPQCGHANKPGAHFCARCGKPLGATPPTGALGAALVCQQCGTLNRVGAHFCARCRAKLAPATTTQLSQKNLLQLYREQRTQVETLRDPLAMFILAYTHHLGNVTPAELAHDLGLTPARLNMQLHQLMQNQMITQNAAGISITPQGTALLSQTGLGAPPGTPPPSPSASAWQPPTTPPPPAASMPQQWSSPTPSPSLQAGMSQPRQHSAQPPRRPPPRATRPASGAPRWVVIALVLGILILIGISAGAGYIWLNIGTATPTSVAVAPTTSVTPTSSQTPTLSPTPSATPSPSPSVTPSFTGSPTPTPTDTRTVTPSPTPTDTRTPTFTPTPTLPLAIITPATLPVVQFYTRIPTPTYTKTPFISTWSSCGDATVGGQASHYPSAPWIPNGSFLIGLDLNSYSLGPYDSPIIHMVRHCHVTGAGSNAWTGCAWYGVESAGRRSHWKDDPPWCPVGKFITMIDLNAWDKYSANDSPIVWQVHCCGLRIHKKITCDSCEALQHERQV